MRTEGLAEAAGAALSLLGHVLSRPMDHGGAQNAWVQPKARLNLGTSWMPVTFW